MSPKSDFRLLVTFSCPGKNVTRFRNNNSGDISPRRTRRDIATLLGIRLDGVYDHVSAILHKIDAANRTEAVAIALRKHLV